MSGSPKNASLNCDVVTNGVVTPQWIVGGSKQLPATGQTKHTDSRRSR